MIEKIIKISSEKNLENMIAELGYTNEGYKEFQKKRLIKSSLVLALFLILAFVKSMYFIPIGIVIFFGLFKMEYISLKNKVKKLKFNKQLAFSKFSRMIIPYLMQGDATLYAVFQKMNRRLEEGAVKKNLQRLMINMLENPNDIEPFKKFAIESSGTDSAVLFMSTLFDYQQNTNDTNVIAELGRMSSEELFETVDEIVSYKLRKFSMFPTKLTMGSFLIILGYAVSILLDAFLKVSF